MGIIDSLVFLFEVFGINAASGIYYENQQLYIISDNSPYLYRYDMRTTETNKVLLDHSFTDEIVKKADKLDLEAMCAVEGKLVMIGSGSKANREQAYLYDKKSGGVEKRSLSRLYKLFKKVGEVDDEDLNIEGLAYQNGVWYFLNRGNGPNGKNIVFSFEGSSDLIDVPHHIDVHYFDLPSIKGYAVGFSDAQLIDDRLYFIATGEDNASTYDDGDAKGSYMGYIVLANWSLGLVKEIDEHKKIEGLTLYKQTAETKTFLLCEDPDDSTLECSSIFAFDFE